MNDLLAIYWMFRVKVSRLSMTLTRY